MKPAGIRTHSGKCPRCHQPVEEIDGDSLREVRTTRGVSLRELARQLGLSASYICDVELNRRRVTPRIERVYRNLLAKS